jgi:hypothetical protein
LYSADTRALIFEKFCKVMTLLFFPEKKMALIFCEKKFCQAMTMLFDERLRAIELLFNVPKPVYLN